MYQIERKDGKVIIRRDGKLVYSDSDDSYVIYHQKDDLKVSRVRDLKDNDLLLALATMVELKAQE